MVDHHLCAVRKVTELRFPHHQGVGVVGCVAVFKTEHSFFRQDGVNHHKRGLVLSHVLQRHIRTGVPLFTVLVMDHSMAVREGAASAVFARQTYGVTTGYQRGKSHVFAHAPIDRGVATAHRCAIVIDFFDQLMRRDGGWNRRDFFSQAFPL